MLLVQTIGNGGSGGFVDDTLNVQASNGTGVLGSLTLAWKIKKILDSAKKFVEMVPKLTVVEVGGDGDNGVLDLGAQVALSNLLHLGKDHGGDFFGSELLGLALVFNLDHGKAVLVDDLEGPVLHISLDFGISEATTDKTLGVKDGVEGVHGDLVLGSITNETFGIGETDVGGSGAVALNSKT